MTYRLFLPLVLGLAGLATSAQGVTYSSNFNGAPFVNPGPVAGLDGWTTNDPGADPVSFPAPGRTSFIGSLNGSQAGGIGGFYDAATLANVELTHSYNQSLNGSSFDVDLVIEPDTALAPGRDTFGWSFKGPANALLFSIILKPNVAIANQLEILWQGPVGAATSTGFDLLENGVYHLKVNFGAAGLDGTFAATVTPGVGAPLNFAGNLTGAALLPISTFNADWDPAAPGGADNFMLFDNLVMVPEPGSALLLGLGLLGAFRRRRA